MANRSLSPKRLAERARLHRQAVATFARLAAKKAVQDNLRAQGVRVSLYPIAELMRQAREYLDNHPELYQLALERAHKLGCIDPRLTKVTTNAQPKAHCSDEQISVQISGAEWMAK